MAALNKQGTVSPVGGVSPAFIGQTYIDTTNDVVYIAYGTLNTEWQEVGAGGGGGGFGVVTSIFGNLQDTGGGTINWDASLGQPLVMKHDQGTAAGTVLVGAGTLPVGSTEIIHNKMIIMQGGTTGNLTIGMSAALATANYDFLYIDEHTANYSYQANETIIDPDNQIYVYDVTIHNIPAVQGGVPVGLCMVTKVGQHTITISAQGS